MRKRNVSPLKKVEIQTLVEMYRNHPKSRLRERAHLVLLSNRGYSIKEISFILCRSENTVATC
jgi:DNA-binding NarL/FixJ family response regulator